MRRPLQRGRAPGPILALLCMAVPHPGWAAPFCVSVQGLPDQCIYADGGECQRRAIELRGVCTANAAQVQPGSGPGAFCLVIGNQATNCVYADRRTCTEDATKQHAACTAVANRPGSSPFDPFAIRRPY